MPDEPTDYHLDKTVFSVAFWLEDEAGRRQVFWHSKTPEERLRARRGFSAKNFMATTLLPSDFKEFLRLLNSNHVE